MVFLSFLRFGGYHYKPNRIPTTDPFWKRRQVLKLTAHFSRRRRNCYSIAIRALTKALVKATKGRQLKKIAMKNLWEARIEAASNEHGTNKNVLLEGLARSNILLDRKILTDLSIREPRTFKCLADVAVTKCVINPPQNGRIRVLDPPPPGIITRGML